MPPPEPRIETIVAISTPPGRGGIGIVRLSGPEAVRVAGGLVRMANPPEHAQVRRARVIDPNDPAATIDDALLTVFLAPHSYTGETLVEIAAHGSPVVLEAMVRGALAMGARLAHAGEFTQRAFFSGRLDLTQAEAVHDLIAAQTLDQARVAAQQMGGAISQRVTPAKSALLHLIALLEAGMDFASGELDDVDIVPPAQIAAAIANVHEPLAALAASFRRGQLLRNGAAIALIGPPNAGKSSLFNRLLERERAIVTPLPGTTRDTVEESLSLGGIPLRLIDTAGLRGGAEQDDAIDLAEQQGIARSHEALADADLVLLIHDATQSLTAAESHVATSLAAPGVARPHLVVYNKVDLLSADTAAAPSTQEPAAHAIRTSALTGEGLPQLRDAILAHLGASGSLAESGALNNFRQQEAVSATLAALSAAVAANDSGLPHELILMDLHTALRALDSLTGATTPDDILARIFSTFCIGK
jgi:tRNA modification GTPase